MTATLTPQGYQYDFQGLEQLWTSNGGDPIKAPVAAAFGLAESGGRSWAISPSNDWGVWQINGGGQPMLDPNANAKRAIAMSNNGQTWTPWCTAYSNPKRDCGHGGPSYLAAGSPVWAYLSGAQAKAAGLTASAPLGSGAAATTVNLAGAQSVSATYGTSGNIPGDKCLLSAPSLNIPIVGKTGGSCLISTNAVRAVGGVLLIGAGAIVAGVGVILLLQQTKVLGGIASALPGPAGSAVRATQAAQQQRLELQGRRQELAERRFEESRIGKSSPGSTVSGTKVMGRSKSLDDDF